MKTKLVNIDIRKNYVDTLLKARGIEKPEDYYNPGREFLQPPTDLENVERGANVLMGALAMEEKILIPIEADTAFSLRCYDVTIQTNTEKGGLSVVIQGTLK